MIDNMTCPIYGRSNFCWSTIWGMPTAGECVYFGHSNIEWMGPTKEFHTPHRNHKRDTQGFGL